MASMPARKRRVVSRTTVGQRRYPSTPRWLIAAHAPAIGGAGRVPAEVPDAYSPPGHSSYQKNWRSSRSRAR